MIRLLIAGPREFTDQIQYRAQNSTGIRIVNITTEPSTTVDALENMWAGTDAVLFGFDDGEIEIMVDVITRNKINSVIFISTGNPAEAFKKWARYRFKTATRGKELDSIQAYFTDRPVSPAVAGESLPIKEERQISGRQARLETIREREREDRNRVVMVDKKIAVIFGQKGGIGKTVTLVSMARSLNALTNMRVALVDLDMNRDYGDVVRYCGILGDRKQEAITMTEEDAVKGYPAIPEKTLSAWSRFPWEHKHDTAVVESCLVKLKENLFVLPPLRSITDESEITYELVQKVLEVLRRHFSVVLVDGGNTLSTSTLAAMEAADDLIILSSAEIPVLDGLADFSAGTIKEIRGNPIISLAINKIPENCSFKLEKELPYITKGLPVVALFPHDHELLNMVSSEVDVPYLGGANIPYTREMEKLLYRVFPKEVFKLAGAESKAGFFGGLLRRLKIAR
ncbi:hypothetical protein DCCM_4592 [Desulfocucumis palustris]|uniref:AAA domain-containing protein n=1 Tax=Desulfocucumis palustris TaxID=1898651 RepID=A0A2L2XID9_9FIRM|nr:AAA family ATPase [Desulfocucumis palustris]GBF35463.1 hypothetical protein DCCM_4592 [Desulfocucumis palustris]